MTCTASRRGAFQGAHLTIRQRDRTITSAPVRTAAQLPVARVRTRGNGPTCRFASYRREEWHEPGAPARFGATCRGWPPNVAIVSDRVCREVPARAGIARAGRDLNRRVMASSAGLTQEICSKRSRRSPHIGELSVIDHVERRLIFHGDLTDWLAALSKNLDQLRSVIPKMLQSRTMRPTRCCGMALACVDRLVYCVGGAPTAREARRSWQSDKRAGAFPSRV